MFCNFKAKRDGNKCEEYVDTYYGYCSKHSRSVQAQKKMNDDENISNGRKENIVRNEFGRFEHKDSHIIFDMATQKAYGHQLENGEVCELDDDDIKLCKLNKWNYQIKKTIPNLETNIVFDDPDYHTKIF